MLLYILFIVFSILLALTALGFLIAGLVKSNRKMWAGGLAGFFVFSMVTVVAIYTYTIKMIDYMGTDEFQAQTKKSAENMGKTWGNTVSGAATGLESTLDDEAIAKLAKKSGVIIGKGVKATAEGLDETVGKTTVFSDKSVDDAGITIGRAEEIVDGTAHNFGLFLESGKDFDGTLLLTAYDSKGLKQDNTELKITQKAGKGKVHIFKFETFDPGLSGYCVLSKPE